MQMDFSGFFTSRKAGWAAGVAVAAMLAGGQVLWAQDAAAAPAQDAPAATQSTAPAAASDATLSNKPAKKSAKTKDKVRESKDTRRENKMESKVSAQVKHDTHVTKEGDLPDKQLYDKALAQQKSGHYDVARLDLQTLLNTYPESQYLMKAKLAVADCWYHEGGSAALTQAEQEYTDFITFFPNAPEAAEAQIRVGDIYFKQMDSPDRDYTKAMKAEDAYRTMLKQYPDAPAKLLTEDKQKLRETQELLATRELSLGEFYASHENWPASIARYQTVVDNYPQFSHMDDALIGVGDGYATEAKITRDQPTCGPTVKGACIPEAAKAAILEEFDGKAAEAYRRVVLEHASAPHVEDAKERLAAMNLPIPTPTEQQQLASDELEGSRSEYTIAKRLEVLFLRKPDTVAAATKGDPLLDDAPMTTAPEVLNQIQYDYCSAIAGKNPDGIKACNNLPGAHTAQVADATAPAGGSAPATTAPAGGGQLGLQDIPNAGQGGTTDAPTTMEASPDGGASTGTGVGVEIVQPKTNTASDIPAASGAQDPNNGLKTVGTDATKALPAVEGAAPAPDQVNEVSGQAQPATDPNAKPNYDKQDESSSKHQPKKGVDKLNPF